MLLSVMKLKIIEEKVQHEKDWVAFFFFFGKKKGTKGTQ